MNAGAVTIRSRARSLSRCIVLVAAGVLAACGGGGSGEAPAAPAGPSAPNALAITVDRGLDGAALNSPFVSVTVCMPGTATCHTVDHVLVDTGSFGLRLMASAVAPALSLPPVTHTGTPVAECAHFATGFVWGSVRRADVKLGGETAASLPVQIIGDTAAPYAAVPAACSNTGANFGADLGVNGLLGIGVFNEDCPACASSPAPAVYFACGTGCFATSLPLASQVANPVGAFAVNNNGVAIVLPAVPPGGAATLSGSLIFGIGTQSNNQLGSATVYATNRLGNFTTTYKGVAYSSSFLDSGSNGIFFTDPDIAQCSGFFCPPMPLALSAVNTSATGVSATVDFTIESIQTISRGVAAAHVGGEIGLPNTFDWGLPFFYGRTVFVAISGAPTPQGLGPYWAY
ncbi:MAG TPA: DUF3443 domain-containing protein [Ramlibacter sp.]|nr:DUF3443 domain-containing protein [Ramlibacter sp.]